jgi:hypothetical protein
MFNKDTHCVFDPIDLLLERNAIADGNPVHGLKLSLVVRCGGDCSLQRGYLESNVFVSTEYCWSVALGDGSFPREIPLKIK